jgi:hypothetical protein
MDKNEIIYRLSQDDQLAKCLLSNENNFLNYELKEGDKDNLAWSHIFPYKNVPQIQNTVGSFITMKFKTSGISGDYFKYGRVTFFAFCHESLVRTPYNDLRYDFMVKRINSWITNARSESWLGKVEFDDSDDIDFVNPNYAGMYIRYRLVEFNK